MNITLYTTHCPKCKVIEKKLALKKIEYKEETDIEKMKELGFSSAPILEVNGEFLKFADANKWINNYKGE
jgi:glutaredoxin